jgi:hypothetical protein
MLAHLFAIAVALGSLALYLAAFFLPEIHRKSDFFWSGAGLFYALVLWVCAGRITGGVLLGQAASVALLGWLGWQTVTLRRALVAPSQQTEISPELRQQARSWAPANLLERLQARFQRQQAPAGETDMAAASSAASEAETAAGASSAEAAEPSREGTEAAATSSPSSASERSESAKSAASTEQEPTERAPEPGNGQDAEGDTPSQPPS